jgi:hypothetical protein
MNPYEAYYSSQAQRGRGASLSTATSNSIGPLYEASFTRQRGKGGCCGVGRVLTQAVTPVLAKSVRAVGQEAANAAFGLIQDIRQDPSPRGVGQAAVERVREAGRRLKRRAKVALVGGGGKNISSSKRRKVSKKQVKSKSKRKVGQKATSRRGGKSKKGKNKKRAPKRRGSAKKKKSAERPSSNHVFDIFS